MEVEHPAAVSVRQRAYAVGRALGGQRPGRVAAAAQDDQRDQLGLADQRVGGGLAGHPDELDAAGSRPAAASAGAITSSASAIAERRAALRYGARPRCAT